MIIPNNTNSNQAAVPDIRAASPAPVRAERNAVAQGPLQSAPQQPSASEINKAVAAINHAMVQSNRSLAFSVDTDTRQTVVKMVDSDTGELIRQFPSAEALAIARGIDHFQQGLLLTKKA